MANAARHGAIRRADAAVAWNPAYTSFTDRATTIAPRNLKLRYQDLNPDGGDHSRLPCRPCLATCSPCWKRLPDTAARP